MTPQTKTKDEVDSGLRNLKSGLYWARSIGVLSALPVILTLEAGQLTLKTKDSTVFTAPIGSVGAKFTRGMTMVLTVNGTTYRLVAVPGNFAKSFSAEQRAELDGAQTATNLAAQGIATNIVGDAIKTGAPPAGGQAIGTTLQAAGAVMGTVGVYQGEQLIKQWELVLANNGVVFAHRDYRGTNILLIIGIAAVVIVIILNLLGYAKPPK